jgi:hypothetical protein
MLMSRYLCPWGLSTRYFDTFFISPMRPTCPRPKLILLDYITSLRVRLTIWKVLSRVLSVYIWCEIYQKYFLETIRKVLLYVHCSLFTYILRQRNAIIFCGNISSNICQRACIENERELIRHNFVIFAPLVITQCLFSNYVFVLYAIPSLTLFASSRFPRTVDNITPLRRCSTLAVGLPAVTRLP